MFLQTKLALFRTSLLPPWWQLFLLLIRLCAQAKAELHGFVGEQAGSRAERHSNGAILSPVRRLYALRRKEALLLVLHLLLKQV